jgi:hypothetical protein
MCELCAICCVFACDALCVCVMRVMCGGAPGGPHHAVVLQLHRDTGTDPKLRHPVLHQQVPGRGVPRPLRPHCAHAGRCAPGARAVRHRRWCCGTVGAGVCAPSGCCRLRVDVGSRGSGRGRHKLRPTGAWPPPPLSWLHGAGPSHHSQRCMARRWRVLGADRVFAMGTFLVRTRAAMFTLLLHTCKRMTTLARFLSLSHYTPHSHSLSHSPCQAHTRTRTHLHTRTRSCPTMP